MSSTTLTRPDAPTKVLSFDEAAAALGLEPMAETTEVPDQSVEPMKSVKAKKPTQKRKLPSLTGKTPVTAHRFTDAQVGAFEQTIEKMAEREGWDNPAHRDLVSSYITSLLNGLTYVPKDLCEYTRRKVARAFMIFCDEQKPRVRYEPMTLHYGVDD